MDEVRGPVELDVQGTVPSWTAGSLFRTGPGTRTIEGAPKRTYKVSHWFDGFAHTHRFDIIPVHPARDGPAKVKVLYSSRRQSEEMVAKMRKNGDKGLFSFGQRRDPCLGLFGKIMSVYHQRMPARRPASENVCVAIHANVPSLPSSYQPASSETVVAVGGHRPNVCNTWLTTDTNCLKEMDPQTLEPIAFATQDNLHAALRGALSCAHAQRDPKTGDLFNFNLSFGKTATYRIFRVRADSGKTDILAEIALSDLPPCYIHSFFLTENYVVLVCTSAHFAWRGMKILWEKNVVSSLEPFSEKKKMKWFVVDRRCCNGVVARFDSNAGFFFHSINAWEEEGEEEEGEAATVSGGHGVDDAKHVDIFCDMIYYPNLDIISSMYYDVLANEDGAAAKFWGAGQRSDRESQVRLVRVKLPITTSSSDSVSAKKPRNRRPGSDTKPSLSSIPVGEAEQILTIPSPHAGELPCINNMFLTRKHRYVYSLANTGDSTMFHGLNKLDMETREVKFWNCPHGHMPGEPIFVARPREDVETGSSAAESRKGEMEEDDGVLLSVVLDGNNKVSYLLCVDARTMRELGRAVCDFPIPLGFHGMHAPSKEYAPPCRFGSR